jgi:hypothetical protein
MAAQSVTTPAAQEFLFALSNLSSGYMGTCEVCGRETERLVELFPARDEAPLIPDDRLVCSQCLMLGIIAVKVGATVADFAPQAEEE